MSGMVENYQLTVDKKEDGTFSAMIECPSFVATEEGLETVQDALAWAGARTLPVDDPFTYED